MTIIRDLNSWVSPDVTFCESARIGFSTCVGYGNTVIEPTFIGDGVQIGAFCVIEHGTHLETRVEIDHYCRISRGTRIGSDTRILYGAQVFDDVQIGRDCIIGGDLVDRTVIEDRVTFQGNTAHSYVDPTRDWDENEEASPIIRRGSVVAVGALIVGGISVGPGAYVAAGEIARCNVPEGTVLLGGQLQPLSYFRGTIKVREKSE